MEAIQKALPLSFAVLAVALGILIALRPGTFFERLYGAFAPAFGSMSFGFVVLLTFDLARRRTVPAALATAVAAVTFCILLPYERASSFEGLLRALGSSGLFLAIGVAFVVVTALRLCARRFGVAGGSLLAIVLVIGAAAGMRAAGVSVTGALDAAIAPLGTLGDSLTALVLITFVEMLLWTMGIHGPALLAAVVLPVYMQLQSENASAFARGDPLPHIVTVSTFLFVFPGGAGATLPLVLMLLRSKVKRARVTAAAALVPSMFNVSEALMFGLPLVLNPYFALPFVLAPMLLAVVTWEAIKIGLVARPSYYIPSSVPFPLSVFFATRDWHAMALLVFNAFLACLVYWPFVGLYERHERSLETAA